MGKKSREKKARREALEAFQRLAPAFQRADAPLDVDPAGDLRLVESHVEHYLKGNEQAENALRMLGRDAAVTVMRIGESSENAELVAFGKRLVAVPPTIATNLYALRQQSVFDHVHSAQTDGDELWSTPHVSGASFALFDPSQVIDTITRSGRPRNDAGRCAQGDIAWFALDTLPKAEVRFSPEPPPEGQPVAVRGLEVKSGIVFVGPPEAADGPVLGAVRLDPFRTALDNGLESGTLRQVPVGRYKVSAYRDGEVVHVHLEVGTPFNVDALGPPSKI